MTTITTTYRHLIAAFAALFVVAVIAFPFATAKAADDGYDYVGTSYYSSSPSSDYVGTSNYGSSGSNNDYVGTSYFQDDSSGSDYVGTSYYTPSTGCTSNCGGGGGGGGCSFNCGYIPPPAPTCTLNASPSQIDYGSDVHLSWTTTNASSVTLSSQGSVSKNGSYTDQNVTYNKTYTLSVSGNGGSVTCTKTVTVKQKPAPTCNLYADQTSINPGQQVKLSWTSQNASYATLSTVGSIALNGSTYVNPSSDTTYTATFSTNDNRTVTCNTTVHVVTQTCPSGYTGSYPYCVPPSYNAPSCTIYVNNNSYNYNQYQYGQYGQPVTITWTSQYATSGWINNGIGNVALQGSQVIYPNQNTTYVATFVGQNGQQVTCSVVVNINTYVPPPVYQNPAPYINLSAVPYTGLDLGPVGTVLYWAFLAAWCLLAAYLIAVKRVHMSIVRWYQKALFGTDAHVSQNVSLAGLSSSDMHTLAGMLRASEHTPAHAAPAAAQDDAIDPFILSQINRAK
ncbi:MAG TPA: hypothetical protein VG753_02835 [Candidatus Paceibacterota bacterium]|nr:hypothetical protein [Candidatus Paceibacterota bacterium]